MALRGLAVVLLFGLGCVLAVLYVGFPALRTIALGAGGLLMLFPIGFAIKEYHPIRPGDLEFSSIRLMQSNGGFRILGSVRNNSRYELSGATVSYKVWDCPRQSAAIGSRVGCTVISAVEFRISSVPPREVRTIDAPVSLGALPLLKGQIAGWISDLTIDS